MNFNLVQDLTLYAELKTWKYKILCTAFTSLIIFFVSAQSNRQAINWLGYLVELENRQFIFSTELENSHFLKNPRQDYFTTLLNAELKLKPVQPGAGLSYWLLYDQKGMIVPEWRPHQQIRFEKEAGHFSFAHRTRIENRFVRDTLNSSLLKSYSFSLRPRILFQAEYSMNKERSTKNNIQFVVSEEVVALFGKNDKGFTESRLYAGVWYTFTRHLSLRLGYMWLFHMKNKINNTDVIYFTLKGSFRAK